MSCCPALTLQQVDFRVRLGYTEYGSDTNKDAPRLHKPEAEIPLCSISSPLCVIASFPDTFEIPIGVESDMKLPNRENAYIPPPKLHDYLLSKTHSVGRWKAKFFRALGFDETNVDVLEQRLIAIAHSEDVRDVVSLKHGAKYVIEGSLQTPAGNLVQVRTVWVIDAGQDRPRFVTAYPV
jgi:hypothetical protein